MKLPGAVRTGVRGLAMMPSVAAYESQKAQSIAQIGQAIGGAVDKIEQTKSTKHCANRPSYWRRC